MVRVSMRGLLFLLLLAAAAPAFPRRSASPNGRHYVDVFLGRYRLYEHAAHLPRVYDARLRFRRYEEDALKAKGRFDGPPARVRVLDASPAVIAYLPRKVVRVDEDGVRWTHPSGAVGVVLEQFGVVVLLEKDRLVGLDLATGKPRGVKPAVLFVAARRGKAWERHEAMARLYERRPEGTKERMLALAKNRQIDPDLRAHASIVAQHAGADIDAARILRHTLETTRSDYLMTYVPRLIETPDLDQLVDAMARSASRTSRAQKALVEIGAPAVEALGRVAWRDHPGIILRLSAVDALAQIGGDRALEQLSRVLVKTDHHRLAGESLAAMIRVGGSGLDGLLGRALQKGTEADDRIVYHFEAHPSPAAVPGLRAELSRKGTMQWRRRVTRILRACEAAGAGPGAGGSRAGPVSGAARPR